MAPTMESLGLDRLSVAERIELGNELLDSVPSQSMPELTEAKLRELRRRLADDDANPDDTIPWEQVKAETHARMHP